MNKKFKYYAIIWAILLVVFNVICFVTPNEVAGMSKFGGAFWAGYIFITLAFIGQLVCAYIAFKAENLKKLFYNLPLITVSYTGLILTIVFGALCMAIPNLPNWVGIIVCLLVLAFTAIAVIKAKATAEAVDNIDNKIKAQTQFIKMAPVNAENIMSRAKSDAVKTECKKVYEALRYSDPMSNETLNVEEAKITIKMDEFANAVNTDADNISKIADEIISLINERNNKCKALK